MKQLFLSTILSILSIVSFSQADSLTIFLSVCNPDSIPEIGAKVVLEFPDKKIESVMNDQGKAEFTLPADQTFDMIVHQYDTVFNCGRQAIPLIYNKATIQIILEKIPEFDETMSLDVHYASGSAVIQEESYPVLMKMVILLSEDTSTFIEIAAHTDSVGDDKSNQVLSQKRAKSVVEYLIDKGIDSKRLTAKGYGEKQPVATNDTEEGRAKNRRTEVRIIKK